MIQLAAVLRHSLAPTQPDFSLLDLKAYYRGRKYLTEFLKLLPEKPDEFLLTRLFHRMGELGSIHPFSPPIS